MDFNTINFKLILFSFILSFTPALSQTIERGANWETASPDGTLRAHITLDGETHRLSYSLYRVHGSQSIQILEDSPLGIELEEAKLSSTLSYIKIDTFRLLTDEYTMMIGKKRKNTAEANVTHIHFKQEPEIYLTLQIKLYDDAFAIRYVMDSDKESSRIREEFTGFKVPKNGVAWIQPYDTVSKWTPAYEKYFENGIVIGSKSPNASGWCFPALFEVNKNWVLITESDLDGSYHGCHLNNALEENLYSIQFPDSLEANSIGSNSPQVSFPWRSPWRLVIVGDELRDIVESNAVYNVARDPIVEQDFNWVKPGRASWSWWSDQSSPTDLRSLKRFVDIASSMNWEYSLVDANWNKMIDGSIEDLAKYAKEKKVGLWLWYNSGGTHNNVDEQPRNRMFDSEARNAEMKRLSLMGIKGVKVDFFQSDKQFIVDQYIDILRDAAKHQIMVNFHGCTLPRGWARTWPNLLSMESVKGAENYLFAPDFPERAPLHNVHLVFTRNVVGSMDYTPVTFSNTKYPHLTSNAHELALSIVFESGIQHFADSHLEYKKIPGSILDVLKVVPTVWDNTMLLDGHPSSHAVIARENSGTWFIGAINGTNNEISVNLDLSFLKGSFKLTIINDNDVKGWSVKEEKFYSGQSKTLRLKGYGGAVIVAEKVNDDH